MQELVLTAVNRRLILSMIGWRFSAGIWSLDGETLSDEEVDCMPPEGWEQFMRLSLGSAAVVN
jgi:hypothetical protein